MGSTTPEAKVHKEEVILEVQKEPETTSGKSEASTHDIMELVIQNP